MQEKFQETKGNKVGHHTHPVAVVGGGIGKLLVIDYQPMRKKHRPCYYYSLQFYNPLRVALMKEGLSDA